MCTAVTYQTKDFYFGRTLDNDFSYGEQVIITPRKFPFFIGAKGTMKTHHAMIGMAHLSDGYPLYYDAVNEKGLAMAGLNFVGNAVYQSCKSGKDNIATYEFIPWILAQCDSVKQARALLQNINIIDKPFSRQLPAAQLHWIIADCRQSIIVESVKDGICVYDNEVGVLTNNPPFEMQMFQLNNYMQLSAYPPENHFSARLPLRAYSRGMGSLGLPGDVSSQSRFIRAAFIKMNSVSKDAESESVNQFFHILGAVEQQRGCCVIGEKQYEITIYTSCCNANKGIYYYTTYENHQICAVDMHKENLDGNLLHAYSLKQEEQIQRLN